MSDFKFFILIMAILLLAGLILIAAQLILDHVGIIWIIMLSTFMFVESLVIHEKK